jgi:catalase
MAESTAKKSPGSGVEEKKAAGNRMATNDSAPPSPTAAIPAKKAPAKKAAKKAAKKGAAKATAPKASPDERRLPAQEEAHNPSWAQQGEILTTAQGVPVDDTDNTLRAGARGPSLLEDFHLREKIMHFDHERIPERVVHARGAGAHGVFELYESLEDLTCARMLCDTSRPTPTFVRFSTVAGSRGSADTARDVRGFATKFYTDEGNFDLVGNNIPVFFIQDGIKFPDLIHAAKPEPDREIPQAQTAHDTFWDFVSLTPESTHMLMWIMSDRAIPRSYRMMEGFGVHTFRLVNEAGATSLVKFHWKPLLGTHGLVWEESQKLGGIDPDFHRRDLWNSIETGAFPEWEFGIQVMPDSEDQMFEGIDLLDSTKIVPEELAPVRRVGKMTLDRNPTNFFAETEQIAFHSGHLPRGIDVTDDPLLHARLFSYLDTQLTRLGGPNFAQIPINRPRSEVNDNLRDGFHQSAIHEGRTPYLPTGIGGSGCPVAVGSAGYVKAPMPVNGVKIRERPASFADHFSQATLFFNSMTPVEQDHIVGAFSFELGKVSDEAVQARMLTNLANVDADLCTKVAAHLGQEAPTGQPAANIVASPALSMVADGPGPVASRIVGIIATDASDSAELEALVAALDAEGVVGQIVAPHGGVVAGGVPVDKTFHSTDSVEFDALVLAGGVDDTVDRKVGVMAQEAYRHHKTVGAWGTANVVLGGLGILEDSPGVVTGLLGDDAFGQALIEALSWHRHWARI